MQEWDTYWAKDQKTHNYMYDRIAVFYRKYIIKPYLFRYCSKYFSGKSLILHAGCGGGRLRKGSMSPLPFSDLTFLRMHWPSIAGVMTGPVSCGGISCQSG